jgi:hypothetical protein
MEEGLATAEKATLQAKELAHQLITFAKGGYSLRKMESNSAAAGSDRKYRKPIRYRMEDLHPR